MMQGDITIVWDAARFRGDWALEPAKYVQTAPDWSDVTTDPDDAQLISDGGGGAILPDGSPSAPISVSSGDLQTGNDLETAVLLSLFTDRRASPDFKPTDGNRRGHWSDSYSGFEIGSRLWQLARAKKTDANASLKTAKGYCVEALQWLLDEKIASSLEVNTSWFTPTTMGIQIIITQPKSPPQTFRYGWAWQAIS